MFEYGFKLDTTKMDKALRRYGQSFTVDDPIVRRGWVVVHRVFMSQQKRNFIARSKGQAVNGIGWPRISIVTAALRRRGKGTKKMKTETQLKGKAARLPALRDTGMLLNSLDVGKPGNVQRVGIMRCTAGTRIEYARKHHEGRRSKPPPLRQSLQRLEANVAKITKPGDPGARSGRTYSRDGTKVLVKIPGAGWRFVPRARQHHNPLFYKLRSFIKRKKSIKPPKRPVLMQPTRTERGLLTKVWAKAVLVPLAKRFNRDANG